MNKEDKIKFLYKKIKPSIFWWKKYIMVWDVFEHFRKYDLDEWKCKCWGNIFIHEHEDLFCISGQKETMCDNDECMLTEDELNFQDKFLHIKNDFCFWDELWEDFSKPIQSQSIACLDYIIWALE